jgi:hypothetical protein
LGSILGAEGALERLSRHGWSDRFGGFVWGRVRKCGVVLI